LPSGSDSSFGAPGAGGAPGFADPAAAIGYASVTDRRVRTVLPLLQGPFTEADMIHVTDTIVLNEREIKERFVRSIGARSQNVDKDATAVELRVDIGRSSLPPEVKDRLVALSGRHVTTEGELIVVSRALRSQAQNRTAARARLVAIVRRAAEPPTPRKPTKPRFAARERRLAAKERRSATKRSRSARTDD
jgi:ribosome-associated protein